MYIQRRKNLRVVVPCLIAIGFMIGLVAYSPTLYRLFCAATGFGGTTQRAATDLETLSDHTVTILFDTNVAPGLPWRFEPEQREVKVRLGEQKLVFFSAENLSDKTAVGHAAFNVSPGTTGIYFNKIQCFCFDDERLEPHEKVDMPVVFFVDPAASALRRAMCSLSFARHQQGRAYARQRRDYLNNGQMCSIPRRSGGGDCA